ncbi:hypothetical protein PSACC_01790 [Paramicrosporidium saccamoebae]|uniref:RING-type E3 ubiquitin transferase n=1 Tax=Paramicrosporidium saccamoebae TaxID=1246581 RepID=A0A2H9TKV8_9FUNG|nr:hypothetical protein PSACC_01790 [Paramicrosporidium saccamoebae]
MSASSPRWGTMTWVPMRPIPCYSIFAMKKAAIVYRTGSIDDMERSVCFICAVDHPPIWAISECSHRICSVCSLRMRTLYGTKKCSMCKTDSTRVVMVRAKKDHTGTFEELFNERLPSDNLGMYFADEQIKSDVLKTLELRCCVPKCRESKRVWNTKQELKHHVHNVHQLSFCDICLAHKKAFPSEYKAYNRGELVKHQNDKVAGHPSCTVCSSLFYSEDELTAHCREKHEQCHICQRQRGGRPSYHRNYEALEEHFRKEHYLCPESLCLELKFVVFETELEYKTHMAEVHMSNLKMQRSEQRQFRRIDPGFSVGADRQQRGRRDQREEQAQGQEVLASRSPHTPRPPQPCSPNPSTEPLSGSVLRHFLYGDAIGDLARRLQSLNMYEQRNIDFCESLCNDYGLTEANVANMKGYCRQFQKGDFTAWDLTLKLDTMLGHERLGKMMPILVDLQLDTHKRMQLTSAINAHLSKIASFPPLPASAEPEYLARRNTGRTPVYSGASTSAPSVLRIKPSTRTTSYAASSSVDPTRNPLALLGASGSLSRSTGGTSHGKKTSAVPPSFRVAVATSSSVGIVDDAKGRVRSTLTEEDFPSLLSHSTPSPTPPSDNIFANSEDRNEPESFFIGSSANAEDFESRKDNVFSGVTTTGNAKMKKKKGQVFLRYG